MFRTQTEQLLQERDGLIEEIEQTNQILNGEKERSDKLDKELMDILGKYQDLKLILA